MLSASHQRCVFSSLQSTVRVGSIPIPAPLCCYLASPCVFLGRTRGADGVPKNSYPVHACETKFR